MYNASLFTSGGDSSKIPGSQRSGPDFTARATNCALLTVTIICVCIMVVCGVMVIREYALSKDYEPTLCSVQNVTYAKQRRCTFCHTSGKDKTKEKGKAACIVSYFPCAQIAVAYKQMDGERTEGLLHPDSLQAAGPHSQCSYEICLKNLEENEEDVSRYVNQWLEKKGQFKCFYNRMDPNHVIVLKMHDQYDVIHSMLWPSIVILVCGVIFLRLETLRRGLVVCASTHPSEDAEASKASSKTNILPQNKDTLIQHIQPANGDMQGKVTCKIVPAQDTDYLLSADAPRYENNGGSKEQHGEVNSGKGASKSGGGKKGKTLDKGRALSNSRSGEIGGYQQIDSNCLNTRGDVSPSRSGHETPV